MTDATLDDTTAELLARARTWADTDPDDATRQVLADLIARTETGDADATHALADAFSASLAFGTAGLRGALGPGPNRMNRVVVMRAAAGLAQYVRDTDDGGDPGAVVVGYDARHNSDVFARDTAAVVTGAGLSAMVLPRALPTPVLAFAIRRLGAAAGVMVTASHNPPQDNGYKVYLGDGSQIVPPADADIAARIDAVTAAGPVSMLPLGEEWTTLGSEIEDDYVAAVAALVEGSTADDEPARDITIVYTAMHGVGGTIVERVLARAGFPAPIRVDAQFDPDPAFPTVAFPNPEEPGAIDLALDTAARASADIVIANDPDADRCAVAVPLAGADRANADAWRMLRGDEVGSLLGWWTVERARLRGVALDGVFAESIVSGEQLHAIAHQAGVRYAQTLTGFKWIGRIPGLLYGYEEALGYCVAPDLVKDKDGISAALLIAELAAHLKAQGRTLLDQLDAIDRELGVYATTGVSVRVSDLSRIPATMARLRSAPPTQVGTVAIERVDDLEAGVDGLPPTDGLRFVLADGSRIIVRPSGTEPKVKCYLQAVVPVDGTDVEAARAIADARLAAMRDAVNAWLA